MKLLITVIVAVGLIGCSTICTRPKEQSWQDTLRSAQYEFCTNRAFAIIATSGSAGSNDEDVVFWVRADAAKILEMHSREELLQFLTKLHEDSYQIGGFITNQIHTANIALGREIIENWFQVVQRRLRSKQEDIYVENTNVALYVYTCPANVFPPPPRPRMVTRQYELSESKFNAWLQSLWGPNWFESTSSLMEVFTPAGVSFPGDATIYYHEGAQKIVSKNTRDNQLLISKIIREIRYKRFPASKLTTDQ